MAIEEKNMDKIGKFFLATLFSAAKLLSDLKVKVRTEFSNVWTKAIPMYKVRTTVPCEYGIVWA